MPGGEPQQDEALLAQQPRFRWAAGGVLRRLEVQHFLQSAADGAGLPKDRFLSHSLRVGGATALYQATSDIEISQKDGSLDVLGRTQVPPRCGYRYGGL